MAEGWGVELKIPHSQLKWEVYMNRTVLSIRIPKVLWQKMEERVEEYTRENPSLWPPIVFALYGKENNHYEIIEYREAPVQRKGDDDYTCRGMGKQGFYPGKGEGKWFSGTLVVGDTIQLDDGDKSWMVRDRMDFRIKMDKDPTGKWSCKAYYIDFPIVSLDLV